jgi:hypothetical protein
MVFVLVDVDPTCPIDAREIYGVSSSHRQVPPNPGASAYYPMLEPRTNRSSL